MLFRSEVKAAWNFIKAMHLKDHVLLRCYANAHTFGIEGYPHTDSKRDQDTTVVMYMNKNWKREWGGETVVYDGHHIVTAAIPAFNRAVVFKGDQYHCARSVSRTCPELRKTIMFKCAKIDADPKRDEMQLFLKKVGASEKKHTNGSLTKHLLETYDLLKAVGQPMSVCLAGATHSLMGTNIYADACLTSNDYDMLMDVIGRDAIELVKLFGKINRPTTIEAALASNTVVLNLTAGGAVNVTPEKIGRAHV